jgi:ubiquinone/menaquinone biosynthesis C-methylase UbiE
MRAIFDPNPFADNASEWDGHWEHFTLSEHYEFEKNSGYHRILFNKYLKKSDVFLEAGCGPGGVAMFATEFCQKVIGVDFAIKTIEQTRIVSDKKLTFVHADVRNLPFEDQSFDVCYSGGVIEHFISGPEPIIAEGLRVLKPGGIFIIFTPYINKIRVGRDFLKFICSPRDYLITKNYLTFSSQQKFHEYQFSMNEFKKIIKKFDVEILELRGGSLMTFLSGRTKNTSSARNPAKPDIKGGVKLVAERKQKSRLRQYVKECVINEYPHNFLESIILRCVQNIFGHLLLAVLKKK